MSSARWMAFAWIVASVVGAACDSDSPPIRMAEGAGSFLELDLEVREEEAQVVSRSTAFLLARQIRGQKVRWFQQVFGGDSQGALIDFVKERLHYVLSGSTNIGTRLRLNGDEVRSSSSPTGDEEKRGATNLGSLWFAKKMLEPDRLQLVISDRLVDLVSTRVGIIQLGPAILRVPQVMQAGVFLHEARHSDCSGGLWASDLERLKSNVDPLNLACGHLHVACPAGHVFAGLYACDGEAWGAYSVNYLYSAALALECQNCSEEELSVAGVAAADAYSRILIDGEAMVKGQLGSPDLTSSDQVVDR